MSDEPPPPPPPAPTPAPRPKAVVSGSVLNGKATSKPQPAYPPIARAAKAQGAVTVQVVVDEAGHVVSAQAVSGHPLLQQAAVAAAQQSRFSPTLLSGQPVSVAGVITYNFSLGAGAGGTASVGELQPVGAVPPDQAEQEEWRQLLAKLHPLVASVLERLREGKGASAEAEAKFVREGKAELRVWLTEKSPAVLAQLKEVGFELILDAPSSGLVVGRLPVEKLPALAGIQAVRYVAPEETHK